MGNIIVIGEKEHILPYQSIGVEIEPVATGKETLLALEKRTQDPLVEIILITEDMAEYCLDAITGLRNKTQKIITIIPAQHGSRHVGMLELNKEMKRTIGTDILG